MFWGVTILGGRRYTQTVERSYHISKAVLEIAIDGKDTKQKRVQVMIEQNKTQFLLCNLDSDKNVQVDLDLIFTEGEDVTFYLNGEGSVHLTGYVLDFDDGDEFDDFDEDLSDEESEVVNSNIKRVLKADSSLNAKKPKVEAKINGIADDDDEDEEDDEEDDDDALGTLDLEAMDDEEDSDEEDDEEDEEDEEEEKPIPIQQKPQQKPQQKQINGQQPKVTPGKGPQNQQNQKTQQSAGKPTPQGGQQNQNNKFGQKGQISPQGQKPFNQNQKGGPQQGQQQKGQFNQNKQQFNKAKGPFTPDQKGGKNVSVTEVHPGQGPIARNGKFVHVRYVGKLANNKEFDRSANKPFSFKLGAGQVIKGWDLGIEGMKVGGKRKIVVPASLGYGGKSMGPIPANSELHFDVELVSVS